MIKREKKISHPHINTFFFFFPLLASLFPLAFTPTFFLLLPPTPNPLPSGKRALRFARPGVYFSPLLFTALKPTVSYRAADVNPLVLAL